MSSLKMQLNFTIPIVPVNNWPNLNVRFQYEADIHDNIIRHSAP